MGRPRKVGKREKNGRLKRAYVNPLKQVASQPHRREAPGRFREFPEAESEFGRLMLNGMITPAQYEAGRSYALLVGLYRAVYGIPSPDPRAIDLLSSMGHGAGDTPPEVAVNVRRRYDDAFIACGEAGEAARKAVNAHAVFERKLHCRHSLTLLRRGLDFLVCHFRINPKLRLERRAAPA